MRSYFLCALLCLCSWSVSANERCLRRLWAVHPESDQERLFDVLNDRTQSGVSFSCTAYMTPTMITKFLAELRTAVSDPRNSGLAEVFDYPFKYFPQPQNNGAAKDAIVITNMQKFEAHKFEIISPLIRDLVLCANLGNINTRNGEIRIGLGAISFSGLNQNGTPAPRPRISEISRRNESAEEKYLATLKCPS